MTWLVHAASVPFLTDVAEGIVQVFFRHLVMSENCYLLAMRLVPKSFGSPIPYANTSS